MLNFILHILLALFTCVGVVQTFSWFAVRSATRPFQVLQVFPVGGDNTAKQMAAMFACLQWEANPAGQTFVLYDVGLDEQGAKDCLELAKGAGASFVRRGELERFIEEKTALEPVIKS